ncbi:hypothetical protein EOD39_3433 [Acipenser ruthenus]|uniref:HAT C-terminal dimerisation domain-containing protein n=1 Tax=Acipenser ruthenus TaxID=7906 RepID=A0A444UNA6_ACIRT|nr:hypothetical protein EOD39_3433 [Acipenser ruthenus]
MAREITLLARLLPDDVKSLFQVVQYLVQKDLSRGFPNTQIGLQALLTISNTVASAEQSFSKLSLIKDYLWSGVKFSTKSAGIHMRSRYTIHL